MNQKDAQGVLQLVLLIQDQKTARNLAAYPNSWSGYYDRVMNIPEIDNLRSIAWPGAGVRRPHLDITLGEALELI